MWPQVRKGDRRCFGRFRGVLSESGSAASVLDVWVMRDDDPPRVFVWFGGGGIG
jgi:hypothetical protein